MQYKFFLMEDVLENKTDEQYLYYISQTGSISRVASELGISQPALSMRLTQLEKNMGFAIFNRKTHPISLTSAGEIYFQYLDKNRDLRIDCFRRIKDIISSESLRITIGAPSVYVNSILVDVATSLHKTHPEYIISIKSASFPQLMEMIGINEIDCFIATSKPSESVFVSIPIRTERTYLCFHDTDPLCEKLPCDKITESEIELLNGQKMIFLNSNQPMQITMDRLINRYQLDIQPAFIVNQITTALSLVSKRNGFCLATSESLRERSTYRHIRSVSMHPVIPDRTLYFSYAKDRYISKACMDIMSILSKKKEEEK